MKNIVLIIITLYNAGSMFNVNYLKYLYPCITTVFEKRNNQLKNMELQI